MKQIITDQVKEILKRIVTDNLDLSDFDVQAYQEGTDFCIRLQKPQPEPNRPKKNSNILIFKFTIEFIEDKQYNNLRISTIAKNNIIIAFRDFDFVNKSTNIDEDPDVKKYNVLTTGSLSSS